MQYSIIALLSSALILGTYVGCSVANDGAGGQLLIQDNPKNAIGVEHLAASLNDDIDLIDNDGGGVNGVVDMDMDMDTDDYDELLAKRAWNDLHGGWGKKRAWNDLHGGWGKRAWNDLHGGWGKRGWNDLQGAWGKKRAWDNFHGSWGKRSPGGGNDWSALRGSWGKRDPNWNNLKGLWGKRSSNRLNGFEGKSRSMIDRQLQNDNEK